MFITVYIQNTISQRQGANFEFEGVHFKYIYLYTKPKYCIVGSFTINIGCHLTFIMTVFMCNINFYLQLTR